MSGNSALPMGGDSYVGLPVLGEIVMWGFLPWGRWLCGASCLGGDSYVGLCASGVLFW